MLVQNKQNENEVIRIGGILQSYQSVSDNK